MQNRTAGIHHITAFAGNPQRNVDFYAGVLGLRLVKKTVNGEEYIRFRDPDGLQLELVERADGPLSEWSFGGVPAAQAIKGFGGAVLASYAPEQTAETLAELLGLKRIGADGGLVRFRAAGSLGNMIDVYATPVARGIGGSGTVHHIAWRATDRTDQERWREHVAAHGFQPTPIVDRNYFTSLYFRETGGILFEIATDDPGFARDEPVEALGERLMLPEWLEPHRPQIEAGLAPIEVRVLKEDLA